MTEWRNYPWGIDISNHQKGANLAKAKAAGCSFVFAKATEGLTYTDAEYSTFRAAAKAIGLPFGAYHFARPQAGRTGVQEARKFLSVYKPMKGDLPPVLDLEDTSLSNYGTYSFAIDWLSTVQKAIGVRPIVYTYSAFAKQHLSNATKLNTYPLWLANYQSVAPPAPNPWKEWIAWQHTSKANIPGIPGNCDRNIAHPSLIKVDIMAKLDSEDYTNIAKAVWGFPGLVDGRSIWGELVTGTNRSQSSVDMLKEWAQSLPADTAKAMLDALSGVYEAEVVLTPKSSASPLSPSV